MYSPLEIIVVQGRHPMIVNVSRSCIRCIEVIKSSPTMPSRSNAVMHTVERWSRMNSGNAHSPYDVVYRNKRMFWACVMF